MESHEANKKRGRHSWEETPQSALCIRLGLGTIRYGVFPKHILAISSHPETAQKCHKDSNGLNHEEFFFLNYSHVAFNMSIEIEPLKPIFAMQFFEITNQANQKKSLCPAFNTKTHT